VPVSKEQKIMGRFGISVIAMAFLAACAPTQPLQGNWIVDIDATARSAVSAGFPKSSEAQVRAIYDDGLMRIDEDRLTLTVEGADEVIAHNYTVLGTEESCTRLRIAPENREHRYCVEGDRLTTHDPDAHFAIVFKRQ